MSWRQIWGGNSEDEPPLLFWDYWRERAGEARVKARVICEAILFTVFLIGGLFVFKIPSFPVDRTTWLIGVLVFVGVFLFELCFVCPYQHAKSILVQSAVNEKLLKSKITQLEERLKSRIKVLCGKEIEGCVSKDHRGIWYRARLDLTGANVSGVEASIIGILEDGVKVNLYGENLDACMCEKEGKGQTVLMREGRPEYINLLFAAYDATKPPVLSLKHYPAPLGDRAYFKLNREYQMSVVVTCDNSHPSVPFDVQMKLKSNDELEQFQLV